MDYNEKYKYISDQLNVLKTEMDDLKNEERVTKNDVIHESNFKRGRQSKRRMLDQVRKPLFIRPTELACTECVSHYRE